MKHTNDIQAQLIQGQKYLWALPELDNGKVGEFVLAYNLSFPIVQTLLSRGFTEKERVESYLFSTHEKDVAHTSLMKDASKAVDRILLAIEKQEKILICGDYDVDGITSSAMMLACLLPLGAKINFFLPHRVKDGYGLAVKTVQRAAENGYKVLITVDNGITAFAPADEAKKLGIDLIITDHHRPHDHLPDAFAIIDPHQADCAYPYKMFAGVGVTFKILSLLYEKLGKPLPPKVYELLLLGTVADVVPLTGENRFWVRYGLQYVNTTDSFCLNVLKQNSRVTKPALSSLDIGFFITPQINALGRLEDARSGVTFLLGSDKEQVTQVGAVLKELNESRKAIEKKIFQDVVDRIERKEIDLTSERVIVACSTEWQPGVIGLVASKLVGAYNRPTILFHKTPDGKVKGSCRSISGFNMFEALQEHKELLISFGGHAMAAGLALTIENLPLFKKKLEETIKRQIPVFKPKALLKLDAELTLPDAQKKLVYDMALLEPFGNENSQPIFYLKNVSIIETPQLLKDLHVKCMVFAEGIIKPVIFFNRPELYQLLVAKKDESISLAVHVTENHFNGKISVELLGVDVAL